jgi:hypothetical protein
VRTKRIIEAGIPIEDFYISLFSQIVADLRKENKLNPYNLKSFWYLFAESRESQQKFLYQVEQTKSVLGNCVSMQKSLDKAEKLR